MTNSIVRHLAGLGVLDIVLNVATCAVLLASRRYLMPPLLLSLWGGGQVGQRGGGDANLGPRPLMAN